MRPLPTFLAAFCVAAMLCDHCAKAAEIILDDFVDPARVESPEMEGEVIETLNVGELSATRYLWVFDVFTDPIAQVDSDTTRESHLTINRNAANANDDRGLARMSTSYTFTNQPIDFTENGMNDAIFIDITSISGPTPPPFIYALVRDHGKLFEAYIELDASPTPSTVAVRFDAFGTYRGGSESTDFEAIAYLSLRVNGNTTNEKGWTVEIDRIRVGRIPEPPTLVCGIVSSIVGCGLWAKRRYA